MKANSDSNKSQIEFPEVMTEDYSEIIKDIGVVKFKERLTELVETMNEFIESSEYCSYVHCNERIVTMLLLDYWSDIYRMKDFHLIEKSRTEKIIAYLIAWIIKRKPLQFTQYFEEEKDIFVNERFCIYLLLNECLLSGRKKLTLSIMKN